MEDSFRASWRAKSARFRGQQQELERQSTAAADEDSTSLTLDKMPVEIMHHILSYLHLYDYFPLKLTNRYIYNIISSLPRLAFVRYIAELKAEDDRRRDVNQGCRSALGIAASRGQEGLVMWLQNIAADISSERTRSKKEKGFKSGKITSTFQNAIMPFKRQRYKSTYPISIVDEWDRSPLHWAAENGQTAFVKVLLRMGVRTWERDRDKKTALDLAVENGHRDVAALLIPRGLFKTSLDKKMLSEALAAAVRHGKKEIVQLLLDGADTMPPGHIVARGTALHVAAEMGLDEFVCLLLDHRADANAKDYAGQTPLHLATFARHTSIISLLLDYGADINLKNKGGSTALHYAVLASRVGKDEVLISLLLDRGADANATDNYKWTPLHHAARKGHNDLIQLLLNTGAHVDAKDIFQTTPLLCAVLNEHTGSVSLLLSHGADISMKNKAGRTALHYAVETSRVGKNEALISLLLDWGADINASDNRLWTPMHYAANASMEGIYQLLKDRGADEDARDNTGKSPKGLFDEKSVEFLGVSDILYSCVGYEC